MISRVIVSPQVEEMGWRKRKGAAKSYRIGQQTGVPATTAPRPHARAVRAIRKPGGPRRSRPHRDLPHTAPR